MPAHPPIQPATPPGQNDGRPAFFILWSPFNRFLPPQIFDTQGEAETEAELRAMQQAGTDWYVLKAIAFSYNVAGKAKAKATT